MSTNDDRGPQSGEAGKAEDYFEGMALSEALYEAADQLAGDGPLFNILLSKAKALERAMARIGCPPGDNADADLYRELQSALSALSAAQPLEVGEERPVMDSAWVVNGCREAWAAGGFTDPDRAAERFRGLYQAFAVGWQEARLALVNKPWPAPKTLSDADLDRMANEVFDKHVEGHRGGQFSEKYIADLEQGRWALTGHYKFALRYAAHWLRVGQPVAEQEKPSV